MNKKLQTFKILTLAVGLFLYQNATAQKKEDKLTVVINNSDTTINGKKFSDLNEKEKVALRKKLDDVKIVGEGHGPIIEKRIKLLKNHATDSSKRMGEDVSIYTFNGEGKPMHFEFEMDSLRNHVKMMKGDSSAHVYIRKFRNGQGDFEVRTPGFPDGGFGFAPGSADRMMVFRDGQHIKKPNSSSYNFSTTDKDGFTTTQRITVANPDAKSLKNIFKNENLDVTTLPITDLALFPNFDSGKTTISFMAPEKANLSIRVLNSGGEILFTEKKTLSSTNYLKSLPLVKNGIYYLEVSDGKRYFVKKIVKE